MTKMPTLSPECAAQKMQTLLSRKPDIQGGVMPFHRLTMKYNKFSFDGKYIAWVTRVIDGDTFVANFNFKGEISEFHIRIHGVDTPEMHPKRKGLTDEEISNIKKTALRAKIALESRILHQYVCLTVDGDADKYGRVLAKVYSYNCGDITHFLISNRYGVVYDGKKKTLKGN